MHSGGVYVHIPFCRRKCPYCDFHSIATDTVPHRAYVDALIREFSRRRREFSGVDRWESVYIGGGTPSLLDSGQMTRLIRAIAVDIAGPVPLEITVEANPNSLSAEALEQWHDAGVTRVSLGVQALNDPALAWLGRIHSRDGALEALDMLAHSGMDFSADMLFGWSDDGIDRLEREIAELLTFNPGHISLYELTVYQGTPLHRRGEKGEVTLVGDDLRAELMERGWDILESAGYEHYEISNFARPGLHSRHNNLYWSGGSYMGLGAAAHGYRYDGEYCSGFRYGNIADPAEYMKILEQGTDCAGMTEILGPVELLHERIMLAMRRAAGLDVGELADYCGVPFLRLWDWLAAPVEELVQRGLIHHRDRYLLPTRSGLMMADTVAVHLAADLPKHLED